MAHNWDCIKLTITGIDKAISVAEALEHCRMCRTQCEREPWITDLIYFALKTGDTELEAILNQMHPFPQFSQEVPASPMNTANAPRNKDEATIQELANKCFFGDECAATEFLTKIRGMEPRGITEYVNELILKGTVSHYGRTPKSIMWKVLHDNDYYIRDVKTWNRQIIIPQ